MVEILNNKNEYETLIISYDPPQGNLKLIDTLADFFKREFKWNITNKNIKTTNGSQPAFFILFNLIAGQMSDGRKKKILLPIVPEYIGYMDQGIEDDLFVSVKPEFEIIDNHTFKYHIDFNKLKVTDEIAAICISRPTNPTGNVITNEEQDKLIKLAEENKIPLIIDNAYGAPFPKIMFTDANLQWNNNMILSMSLSKLGLPSIRTGIIIADEKIIEALGRADAIVSLAVANFGPAIMDPLIKDSSIIDISKKYVTPYYKERSNQAISFIKKYFDNSIPYYIHKSEGTFFLWIWLKDIPVKSKEIYNRLKKRDVIIVPGEYFFTGLKDEKWKHIDECIRINFGAAPLEDVEQGIKIIAEEIKKAYRG
jgi:valine--pyruvate aminotransferase